MKIKGLSQDYKELDQPPEKARFARNAILSNDRDAAQNEPGHEAIRQYNEQEPIVGLVGTHTIGDNVILFEKIGSLDGINEMTPDGTVTTLFNDSTYTDKFNFSDDYPITAEHYINPFGERVIAWIDGLNPPRIINLDNPDVDNLNDTLLFPKADQFTLATADVRETGGSLLSGAYYVTFRYEEADGTYTNWFSPSGAYFTTDESGVTAFLFDGAPPGTATSFSLFFQLTDLDDRYDFIRPAVIEKIGGVIRVYQLDPLTISSTVNFLYTGAETKEEISLEALVEGIAAYSNAQAITQLNNRLYLGNLETDEEIDLQSMANNITVNWTTDRQAYPPAARTQRLNLPEGFKHGEVYALYVQALLDNGTYTRAFHIPGRQSIASDLVGTSVPGTVDFVPAYQFRSTATAGGVLGFWENENEFYPAAFPDFPGERVRHHRMPDLQLGIFVNGSSGMGDDGLPIIDLEFSNVIIPAEYADRIQGWRILYAQKNSTNATVLGYDLIYPAGTIDGQPERLMNPMGPWNFQPEIGGSPIASCTPAHYDLIGHNHDFLFTKAALAPVSLIRAHVTYVYPQAEFNADYASYLGSGAAFSRTGKVNGDDCKQGMFVVSHRSLAVSSAIIASPSREASVRIARYIPENVNDDGRSTTAGGVFQNVISEELIYLEMNDGGDNNLYSNIGLQAGTDARIFTAALGTLTSDNTQVNSAVEIPLCSYEQLLTDVHVSYLSQLLAVTDGIHEGTSATIMGADARASVASWQSNQTTNYDDESGWDTDSMFRFIWSNMTESTFNWNMRHEDQSNPASFYYPKTTPNDLMTDPGQIDAAFVNTFDDSSLNQFLYNTDYSSINNIWPITIYNPLTQFSEVLPDTIIRSVVNNPSSPFISWKTFLPSDAYVMPRHRGPIYNLQGLENERLLVHCEDSMFITRDRSTLTGTQTDISLGAADIFDLQPMEVLTTNHGYAGLRHRTFAALTKVGYLFVDDKQGKVFKYMGQLEELGSDDMSNFLRDNFTRLDGRPFSLEDAQGYTIDYDEYYDRIIIGKISAAQPVCLSYAIQYKGFASFHDWEPNWLFSTRANEFFSYKVDTFGGNAAAIFRHRQALPGRYYQYLVDETVEPFQIDMVFNSQKEAAKVYQVLQWNTLVEEEEDEVWEDTFTEAAVYTFNKVSGWIPVIPKTGMYTDFNAARKETIWRFNGFRNIATGSKILDTVYNKYEFLPASLDTNTPWFRAGRFIDKHLVARLRYSNESGRNFSFFGAEAISRQSFR